MALSSLKQNKQPQDEVTQQTEKSIQSAMARFQAQGITPPAPKETRPSFLQRAFSVLNVANPAPYAMAATRGMSASGVASRQLSRAWQEGIKGQPWESATPRERRVDTAVFSDVLQEMGWRAQDTPSKVSRAIVGLGLDVVLDPKTWLTYGVSRAATKIFVPKKGIVGLSKTGTRGLKDAITEFGEEAGHKKFAAEVARTGNRYLAPSGLKFMGKTVVPQKWFKAPVKYADKFLEKIPVSGRIYKAVKAYTARTVRPAFSYWADIDSMPKAMKDEFRLMEEAGARGNKAMAYREFIKVQNLARKAEPTYTKNLPGTLSSFYEAGGKVTHNSVFDNILAEMDRVKALRSTSYTAAGKKLFGKDFYAPMLGRAGFSEDVAPLMVKISDFFNDAVYAGRTSGASSRAFNLFQDELSKVGYKDLSAFKKIIPRIKAMERGELPVHLEHILTQKGMKFHNSNPGTLHEIIQSIKGFSRGKPGFEKQRGLLGTAIEVNKKMRPLMEKAGIKMGKTDGFFEENIFKNIMMQFQGTTTATNSMRFYREVFDRFALNNKALSAGERAAIKSASQFGIKPSFIREGVTYVPLKMTIFGRDMASKGYVPEQILGHLKTTHNLITGKKEVTNSFLQFYDKLLGIWKGDVTGWFPAFHSRNAIGGTWNSWMMGLKNPVRFAQNEKIVRYIRARNAGKSPVDEILNLGGKDFKISKIVKAYENHQIIGQAGSMDTMRTIQDQLNFAFNTNKAKSIFHNIGEAPQRAMETVENRLRGTLFIDRLAKGEDFSMAAKAVYASQFDYAPEFVTAFEKNVLKRVIPFYTWTRNNIPYQLMSLVKSPGKFNIPEKIKNAVEAMEGTQKVDDERKYLPDWLNNMFTIRLPDIKSSGEAYYLQLDLPIEDINRLGVREVLSMMSPLLKYPIESIANKNIYFDTPIYDKSLPREYQLSKAIDVAKHLPKPVKEFLGIQEVSWKNYYTGEFEPAVMMDSRKLHFVRSLWTSRFYSFFNKLLDKDSTYPEKFSQLLVGEPIRPLDMTEQEWRKKKEYDVMLRDLLYHMLRTERMPYSGEEEDFQPGTAMPSESFASKLGRQL